MLIASHSPGMEHVEQAVASPRSKRHPLPARLLANVLCSDCQPQLCRQTSSLCRTTLALSWLDLLERPR